MKTLIDGKILNGEEGLLMIYLTEKDKDNIRNMKPECSVYAQFPDRMDVEFVLHEMEEFKKKAEQHNDVR
jgi:hypothetical protein